jgi:hypothetical protein
MSEEVTFNQVYQAALKWKEQSNRVQAERHKRDACFFVINQMESLEAKYHREFRDLLRGLK